MTDDGRTAEERRLAGAEARAALEADATPDRVEIRQGGAGRVEASEVSVRQGAVGLARGERVAVRMGAVGAAVGRRVDLRQSLSRLAAARDSVHLEQSGVLTVIANRVEVGRQSGVVFLFARNVQGNVRTLFDWRAGLAFGVGAGLIAFVAGLLPRRR